MAGLHLRNEMGELPRRNLKNNIITSAELIKKLIFRHPSHRDRTGVLRLGGANSRQRDKGQNVAVQGD